MPDTSQKISFEQKGIGDVLSGNWLAVPLNQREYSWEEEHVVDLFTDFSNAITNNSATYFLGTIVLTNSGSLEVPEVSDGQQRLATTTILLAAIRDYCYRNDERDRADALQVYLITREFSTNNLTPKLRLNVDDNQFFKDCVLSLPDTAERRVTPIKDSHKRIKRATEIAADHVQKILAQYAADTKTSILVNWVNFIREGAQVILLKVPDHLNAFMMFETLNDRGLKASQADLIKNHLLSQAGNDHIIEAQQKWAQMVGTLEAISQDDITVAYLHHFLIAKHGHITARDVFDKVKASSKGSDSALRLLDELAIGASDYAAIFNSDHNKWNEYGTSTRKCIATINRDLRVQQVRPLMFAVARYFKPAEADLAFRLFVYWSVRFLIVGNSGGTIDRNYAIQAKSIGDKTVKTAKELAIALANTIPSDTLFEGAFAGARVSQINLARYYLRALEMQRKGLPEPEFIPTDNEEHVNLEHILPEKPDFSKWVIIPEAVAANYRRIGNMALMQSKKNSIIGNSSFTEKKKVFCDSAFLLTSELAEYDDWGIPEIETRQAKLAKLAVKTWPATLKF